MSNSTIPDNFDSTLKAQMSEEIESFLTNLYATFPTIDQFDHDLDRKTFEELKQRLQDKLLSIDTHGENMIRLIGGLENSIELLLRQRQSSKAAFKAGWNGFFHDLRSRLTPDQIAMLRPIFVEMFMDTSDF